MGRRAVCYRPATRHGDPTSYAPPRCWLGTRTPSALVRTHPRRPQRCSPHARLPTARARPFGLGGARTALLRRLSSVALGCLPRGMAVRSRVPSRRRFMVLRRSHRPRPSPPHPRRPFDAPQRQPSFASLQRLRRGLPSQHRNGPSPRRAHGSSALGCTRAAREPPPACSTLGSAGQFAIPLTRPHPVRRIYWGLRRLGAPGARECRRARRPHRARPAQRARGPASRSSHRRSVPLGGAPTGSLRSVRTGRHREGRDRPGKYRPADEVEPRR